MKQEQKVAYSRRGMILAGLVGVTLCYQAYIADHLRQIGKAAGLGLNVAQNITTYTTDTVNAILNKRSQLEEVASALSKEDHISKELMETFNRLYQERKELLSVLRRVDTDYEAFCKEVNSFAKDHGLSAVQQSSYYRASKWVYENAQKALTGRDVTKPQYLKDFIVVGQKSKNLEDAIRGVEEQISQCDPTDVKKAQKLFEDYVTLVTARKEFRKQVREQKIGTLVNEEITRLDKRLEDELGKDYMVYAKEYHDSDLERTIPLIGLGAALALGYAYAIKPLSSAAAAPVVAMVGSLRRRKKEEKNDQRPKDV